jgi:CHAT domain-containing protein
MSRGSYFRALHLAVGLIGLTVAAPAGAQTRAFAPPPRTIADIAAVLDQEKPDPAKRAAKEAEAAAEPAASLKGAALSTFYLKRGEARADLGRAREAIADGEKALQIGGDYVQHISRVELFLEGQHRANGEYKRAIAILEPMAAKLNAPGSKGRLFAIYRRIGQNYAILGDLTRAEGQLKRLQALLSESRNWSSNTDMFRASWEANVETLKARLFEARGRYAEAEQAHLKTAALNREAKARSSNWPTPPSKDSFDNGYDFAIAWAGRSKARQGRLAEGELDVRKALIARLHAVGKYNADVGQLVLVLANLMAEQTRQPEAEKLARTAIDIFDALGFPKESQPVVSAMNQLASTQFSQGLYEEAGQTYDLMDEAMKGWDEKQGARFRTGWARIFTSYYTRKVQKGIELARVHVTRTSAIQGDKHYDTAMARAVLGSGLAFARRDQDALQEFKTALPALVAGAHDSDDDDDATSKQSSSNRLQAVIETYLTLLARSPDAAKAAAESVPLGELIRGRSVQNALAASGARAAAKNPAMAELVRKDQDLEKQIAAQIGAINNMLALPPEERDETELRTLQTELDTFRKDRRTTRRDIERRFPEYASLISPKPMTVEDIREALRPEEAFVSVFVGRRNSYAWAIPKTGDVAFAALSIQGKALGEKLQKLRAALSPNISTVDEIPPFDVALAHELYTTLLKPVASGWQQAKSLIVVTNGVLGTLPLGLLPTEPVNVESTAEPLFAGYRKVAWLARTHAITTVPSAASLRTLRRLPAAPRNRENLIGFGDPLFNAEQAAEQGAAAVKTAEVTTRGVPIRLRAAPRTRTADSADIGMLPRLPDTADELKSIALALEADPSKILHLGKDANERTVKGTDLSRYRIVAFATHGLVPGELDGLTQPALALSAPAVADTDGDGLLTMDEILSLRLNADWVVLSACNTGSGAGEGAEAATGLGRAFFYAGTRALLVTNWSVHSDSARELVTDLFRRQGGASKVTRAEALRAAMMAMLDTGSYKDASGKVLFSYAHPLFWAPYTIIGDGGREN